MYWDVIKVDVVADHTIHVHFSDGLNGEIEFKPSFFRGVFSPFKDKGRFREVHITGNAVTFPEGLDLAPDAMHEQIKAHGRWVVG